MQLRATSSPNQKKKFKWKNIIFGLRCEATILVGVTQLVGATEYPPSKKTTRIVVFSECYQKHVMNI
jgi:hypothetical protein